MSEEINNYTVKEAAAILEKTIPTIYSYIRKGKLQTIPLPKWRRKGHLIPKEQVESLLRQQQEERRAGWTTAKVATFLGLSRTTVHRLIHEGKLPATKGTMSGKEAFYVDEQSVRLFAQEQEEYLQKERLKRRSFYDKEKNIAFYQHFSSPSVQEARLIWNHEREWSFLIIPTHESIPYNEGVYKQGLTPAYEIRYGEPSSMPGLAKIVMPLNHPLTMKCMDIIYSQCDIINLYMDVDIISTNSLTLKMRQSILKDVPESVSTFMKDRLKEGVIRIEGETMLIASDIELLTIQLPIKLKDKLRKSSEAENKDMQDIIVECLEEKLKDE